MSTYQFESRNDELLLLSFFFFFLKVTSKKDQQQYWMRADEPYRFVTVNEFVEAFQSFHIGQKLKENLSVPFDKTTSHPAALTTRKYGTSTKEILTTCARRELLLMKRNSFVYSFKVLQVGKYIYYLILFISSWLKRWSYCFPSDYSDVIGMYDGLFPDNHAPA